MTGNNGKPIDFTATHAGPNYYILECSALVAETIRAAVAQLQLNAAMAIQPEYGLQGDELAAMRLLCDRAASVTSALAQALEGVNALANAIEAKEMEGKAGNDNDGSNG